MTERYYARCASDRNPDWPCWFVADARAGGLNVTTSLWAKFNSAGDTFCLMDRDGAEALAAQANRLLQPENA